MKYLKIIFISGLILTIGTTGCESLLEEEMLSSTPLDSYYSIEGEVDLAMNGIYARFTDEGMWRACMMTAMSDVPAGILSGGAELNGSGDKSNIVTAYMTFNFTKDLHETDANWSVHYDGIGRANTLLTYLPDAKISDAKKAWYEGQTKFLRAYLYWDLVKLYGGVPLKLEATLDLSDIYTPKSTAAEIYAQIEADLGAAETLLSGYNDPPVRATAAGAKALLAKVYCQQGKWSQAAAKAKEVMDMNKFSLWADYKDVFRPENEEGKENIFVISWGGTANATGNVHYSKMIYAFGPPQVTLPDGSTSVTFNTIKFPITYQVNQDFFDATPDTWRKQHTMRDEMDYYYVGSALFNAPAPLYAPFLTKFRYMDFGIKNLQEGVPMILLRYSDVLLMYAEAVNEVGGPTAEAYAAINQVRQRARAVGTANEQGPGIYPDLAGLTQAEFRDAVIDEMLRELIGEEKGREILLRHDRFISDAVARGISAQAHHKLMPFPGDAVTRNDQLEQNPGY
jgi:starch-binding outer membrane protein, SusD/RagB family